MAVENMKDNRQSNYIQNFTLEEYKDRIAAKTKRHHQFISLYLTGIPREEMLHM